MHGLINRSLQCFLRDTYGASAWACVAQDARLGFDSFEAMLTYDAALTDAVINAAAHYLDRPRETVLEDLGTYLVSHPNVEALRRLLRFGGVSFLDFLHSLEDLPGRGRMAVPDLDLPSFALVENGNDQFSLTCRAPVQGGGQVMMGLLRTMADDYGALVVLDHQGLKDGAEVISIQILEQSFAAGRRFDLAAKAG
jgi:Haem-NO-binding